MSSGDALKRREGSVHCPRAPTLEPKNSTQKNAESFSFLVSGFRLVLAVCAGSLAGVLFSRFCFGPSLLVL